MCIPRFLLSNYGLDFVVKFNNQALLRNLHNYTESNKADFCLLEFRYNRQIGLNKTFFSRKHDALAF
jgi:hypothetical protein